MRLQNKEISILVFFITIFLFTSCKRDVAGCNDIEATNWSTHATLNDGSCDYLPCILDPSFERGDWSTYSGTWYSPFAYQTDQADGFMPTAGKYYFKCTPTPNYINGTLTRQYTNTNKHCKGFYFDYCYIAKGGEDSVLYGGVSIGAKFGSSIGSSIWNITINENAKTFNGFPLITIKKRDEYVEIPSTEGTGNITIVTHASSGTFTFCIDNIREVKR